MLKNTFIAFLLALATVGCVTPISTIASHTIVNGADSSQDVVWLVIGGVLQRCTAVDNQPVCKPVPSAR